MIFYPARRSGNYTGRSEIIRLSKKPKFPDNGKEDRYERLRPQARFGAQPPLGGGT
jgi:hypothetical protein